MNPINVGNRISKLRAEKNMTQAELAEKLGVSDKAVSKWEVGGCYPDVTILPHLSDLFGVSIDYILRGKPRTIQHLKSSWLGNDFNNRTNQAYLENGWRIVDLKIAGDGEGGGVIGVILEKEVYDE